MRVLLFVFALLAGGPAAGADQAPHRTFAVDQIIEHVPSASVPGQSFTIYLPPGFAPNRPVPVLYLMDPRRRARVPVELFKPAAERFGYVLVSSHNTVSDEAAEPTLRALQAMWTDTHDWFTVDDRRVYLGGFSGTARIAWLLARHLSGTFTGVIGAAAGAHPEYPPTKDFKFLYFGTAGTVDYNYWELQRLEERLIAIGLRHRIENFDGPHSWMPKPLATRAIEWFELNAIRTGIRPADAALVEELWQRDLADARTLEQEGSSLEASWSYRRLALDYKGLRDTTGLEATAEALARSADAGDELERRQDESRAHKFWTDWAMSAISEAFRPGTELPARTAVELAGELGIASLKKDAATHPDRDRQLEARRRLNEIEVQLAFYLPREAIARAEYLRAALYLQVAVMIDDRSAGTWYLAAVAQARLRETRAAVSALQRAVDLGFGDLALLDAEPAFAHLSDNQAFLAIVGHLRDLAARR